jgi:potassium efflux system protein
VKRSFIHVVELTRQLPKWERFLVFLALTGLVAAAGSTAVYFSVLRTPPGRPVKIALIAPLTGPQAALGHMMRDGAEQWIASRVGQPSEHALSLSVYDEATTPDALARAAADSDVAAVIGPMVAHDGDAAILAERGLPQLAISGAPATDQGWSFPLSADPVYEARFLANYVRNVMGEKLVSIIRPDTPDQAALAAAFDETLQRFGTRVVYQWPVSASGEARQRALREVAGKIASQQIAGTLLVLGDPEFAADTVAALGAAEVGNQVIGLRGLATNAFRDHLRAAWRGPGSLGAALNKTLLTTPLLFDTAGTQAQAFQSGYRAATGQSPDWMAMLGYDAARAIDVALDADVVGPNANGLSRREALRGELRRHRGPENPLPGLLGPIFFEERTGGALPTMVGTYDGQELVAAQTQLSPIRDEGVSNYLEQLSAGRVLYANDRFMYKTNVVPVGIRLSKITNLDTETNTADLEFMLWFRWRGAQSPNDVVFENAVQPIVLGTPERVVDDGDRHYRAWRVRGKFFLNFSHVARTYGSQVVDITLRHRTLARNNLMYVADIVGMDLANNASTTASQAGWMARVAQFTGSNLTQNGSALLTQLNEARVLAGAPGWLVDQALISQELAQAGTDGDPSYVGFGKPQPLFSTLAIDATVKPDAIDVRGLVSDKFLVYVAIFAMCGAILAYLLDRRDRGQFWRMQTLVLRLITWPLLLAAASALALDYALSRAGLGVVQSIDFLTRAAWWLVPALLMSLMVERFVWVPLESRTQRRVPTVFRVAVSLLIYAIALLGLVSFVMGRSITSLLATSGVLAFIIGLALQSNLKDIFSGLMLNLERPFVLNDWVRIGRTIGQVVDVSWRTTRLHGEDGQMISFPNGTVVGAEIENLTRAGFYDASVTVYLDPRCPPDTVLAALQRAVGKVTEPAFLVRSVRLKRIENINGSWVANYGVGLSTEQRHVSKKLRAAVWEQIWLELAAADLTWGLHPNLSSDPAGMKVAAE